MSIYGDYEKKPFLAELYDLQPRYKTRGDLEFYINFCKNIDGKILELGCGTGRVLLPIAEEGIEIVGLDISPHMIAKCKEKLAKEPERVKHRVHMVEADISNFDLNDADVPHLFDAAIIPFRPFQNLVSTGKQLSCLNSVYTHLVEGGLLAFDIFNPDLSILYGSTHSNEKEDQSEVTLENGKKMRRCSRILGTHQIEQYIEVEVIYYLTNPDGTSTRLVQTYPFRYFFRYEVEHLLARAGFDLKEVYGNFDTSPLCDSSPEMIFIAEKNSQ